MEAKMEKLLTPDEVCSLLGIEKSTLYAWTSRRRIPFLKINGLLRFREKYLEQWLRKKKIEDNISEDLTGM